MKKFLPLLLLTAALSSCLKPQKALTEHPEHQEVNAVYYWKTVFQLDSSARQFMAEYDVKRIYLRLFDVTADDGEWGAVPNASIRVPEREFQLLKNEMDSMETVPVVYITLDGLRAMTDREGTLAKNIVNRVHNMVQYNSLPGVSELQLDCDWTESTEEQFFTLCDSVRKTIKELELPWRLSSTIRLHQLAKQAPPVDAGVLMVYNTGTYSDPDTKNSIINIEDIMPYLKRLNSYPLHLDVAYPTYSWQLIFRDRKFAGITSELNLTDTSKFEPRGENLFIAVEDIPYNDTMILKGDLIRLESSDFKEIETVKREIEKCLSSRKYSNIIYHLDPENLKNYSSDEIKSIYAVGS
ncbi:MAG: hypothetical protein K2K82_04995 [Muribaculaceae bacterium]|nr:hypothetical protein [Muribaculaceae bacterium]